MWVVLYLVGVVAILLAGQTLILRAMGHPFQWGLGATSAHPKSVKLALKVLLQTTLIGSILLFPSLRGVSIPAYYGPLFPAAGRVQFLYGEVIALVILATIYGLGLATKGLFWKARWPASKALVKSGLSALSSLTVVSVEEPFFRAILLKTMLDTGVHWAVAIPVSAVLFSGAHYLRRVRTYWPSVGLAVLGIWLGVAFYKTGSLWLPMGLHSGGILSIGIHRCFINYRGPEWLVGTQTYPIAGVAAIAFMLVGATITWLLFS